MAVLTTRHAFLLGLLVAATLATNDCDDATCKSVVYHVQTMNQGCPTSGGNEPPSGEGLKELVARLQREVEELKRDINQSRPGPHHKFKTYHYMDEVAQGSCVGLMSGSGWMYAVRRPCPSSLTCAQICSNPALRAQDPQVAKKGMACVNSLHVYPNRPRLGLKYQSDTQKLGLKTYKYNNCSHTSCGPNYCCCKAA